MSVSLEVLCSIPSRLVLRYILWEAKKAAIQTSRCSPIDNFLHSCFHIYLACQTLKFPLSNSIAVTQILPSYFNCDALNKRTYEPYWVRQKAHLVSFL